MMTTFNPKPSKTYEITFAHFGMIINMDEVIGYSYTGIGNGVVAVIYWVGC